MDIIVIKRDGSEVPYDRSKIVNAINRALMEVDGNLFSSYLSENVAQSVDNYLAYHNIQGITVEQIQDLVELYLMDGDKPELARAYIRYRYMREVARGQYKELMDTVGEKLSAANVQNQNANVDEYSFGGRMGEMNSAVARKYALDYIVSPMARENHLGNMIYIHDLDAYAVGSHNCLTIPFDDLLAKGFNTRQTDVRPAQSVSTAFQLVAVIFQLQSLQQFGGVSASHIDWTMVPYVRKSFTKHMKDGLKFCEGKSDYKIERFDKWLKHESEDNTLHFDNKEFKELHSEAWAYALEMTEREVYQAVEAMYHNLKIWAL